MANPGPQAPAPPEGSEVDCKASNPTSENTLNVKRLQNKLRMLKRTGHRLESENCIKFGTWNIRTFNKPGALQCMWDAIQKYNITILALQGVRWPGEGNLKKDDKTIFYSGNRME